MAEAVEPTAADEARWPNANGRRVVFLLDAASPLERRALERWIENTRPPTVDAAKVEAIPIPPTRRHSGSRKIDPRLEASIATGDDPLMAPLRVAWLPEERNGTRAVQLSDLYTFGDPRDPGRLRQAWLSRRRPDRRRILAAEPAPVSELRKRWRDAGWADAAHTTSLADFVVRQAALALERAERRLRGARYKVPRFVHEDILARPAFRGGIAQLAREVGKPEPKVLREASKYLREIAATHSPYIIDLVAHIIRLLYTQGYSEALYYDRNELERIYALTQRYPVVFLPSHKSNLDHLVLQYALHENGHPPNHTAGGINMNFFPMGPLLRRSGVFFIRRSFKDNAVYKFVLRSYIDYLIEKRFSLEWYIEGGRSRSGKLLPPMFGMLTYVVDAYRRGRSDDVFLIPVSIAYDQIQDVGDYVAEQHGAKKQRESFGWFLRFARALRRRYGEIHIRFGEPVSLREALGPPDPDHAPEPDERNLSLQKLAFEVSVRINEVTPITTTSLVTLALLGVGDRAVSVDETMATLRNLVSYVRRRKLPTTVELTLDDAEGVGRALDTLVESGVVSVYREGAEAVYAISRDQHLTAAYYRNTIIHFFVNGAIAELALLRAAEDGITDRRSEFWEEALRLRDLLKFEFFFAEKAAFRDQVAAEIALHDADWERALDEAPSAIHALIRRFKPFSAHRVLRPFLEAYRVVGDALERRDPATAVEDAAFLDSCLALGKQYELQRRIRSAESVSKVLFGTALSLARNRGLVIQGDGDLKHARAEFAAQMRDALRRVDAIDALAVSRRVGLID